ncbi:hypothetical protein T484DRAFT_2290550 [Baffinella frigidus]|nr:hypothetical protein T484DRAFT_2290550 [Cryptophyta sp. CCMP2293]
MENWVMRGRGMAFLGAGARGGLALVLVLALVERGAGTCVEECADESATDCWRELSSAGNGKECTAKTNDWVRISVGSDADCLAGCCAEEGVERDHVEYNTLTKSCKCGVCTAYGDKSWDRYRLFTIPAVTSTTCAAGLYHDGDFVCVDCGVGTFKAASGTATSCDPCAADTYQDAEGQTTCTDCPGDSTTASDTGRTAKGDCVLGCPEGQRHDGDGACVNCGAGTFKVGTNTATSCDACGTDTYQDVEGQEECTACPGASTSDARSGRDAKSDCELTCAAGEFHTGEGVCADCAAGRYKAASGTEVSCTACTAGYQDETKQAECKACPGGSASLDGSGRDEKSDCVMTCGEGVYHTGEGVCANCAAGTSKADENTDTTCSDCEVDTYQNLEGQEECKTCPRNSASGVVVGARDDVADCKCLLGYEADDFGMDCTKCALGAYKNWTGPGACVQCAAAFHTTAAEGEVSEDACLCMSGFGAIPSGFPEEGTCIGASRLSPGNRFAGAGMLEMRVTGDSLSPSDLSLQARFGGTAAERTRWESSTSVALLAPGGVGHGLGVAITVSQV